MLPRAAAVVRDIEARCTDRIELDYDARRKRRIELTAKGGLRFLVDLADSPDLKAGDAYRLDDGRHVLIEAAPEQLMELTCVDAQQQARIAWHIGNRHLPAAIAAGVIRIRADHVIADLARGLGAQIRDVEAPFEPEEGTDDEA